MQAITIAIGKSGIELFAKAVFAAEIIKPLQAQRLRGETVLIPDFNLGLNTVKQLLITLSNGGFTTFNPQYSGLTQAPNGQFSLVITAENFAAKYQWAEVYSWIACAAMGRAGIIRCLDPQQRSYQADYSLQINRLVITTSFQFKYDEATKAWTLPVTASADKPDFVSVFPAGSILQQEQSDGCFATKVSDATAAFIQDLPVQDVISDTNTQLVHSILKSGDIGNGIVYDFSLGDDGLVFPADGGMQIGVKGGASYQDAALTGTGAPRLPLPAIPAADAAQHLNIYVSYFEFDSLHQAFCKAGRLDFSVRPDPGPYQAALAVSNYTTVEPALAPYEGCYMSAAVTQRTAPTSAFGVAYCLTDAAMSALQTSLPADVFGALQPLRGKQYASPADLEAALAAHAVPQPHFSGIEAAATKTPALIVKHDMDFALTVETAKTPLPQITMRVQRTDVLANLRLGAPSGGTQTLQYDFLNSSSRATTATSTIAGFDGATFAEIAWSQIAEHLLEGALTTVGKTGVPLPIMADFQFVFDQAKLSLQQDYVFIQTDVSAKTATASLEVA